MEGTKMKWKKERMKPMVLIGIRSISMNSFTLKKSRINDIPIAMSTTNAQTPWFQKANPLK